jgi:pantoate--beta-alanine ligase
LRKACTLRALHSAGSSARASGKTIAFVATMGNIHPGHVELVREARRRADFVAVSIYVNPTQFSPGEDLTSYPNTMTADGLVLAEEGVDILYLPSDTVMYPDDIVGQTWVEVPLLGDIHCGEFRPGHFRGVTTVVARLLNMVQPHMAFFGKKDYQQLVLIKRMVRDLAIPVEIIGVKTVREPDGLAYSSRNSYLTKGQRENAAELYQELRKVRKSVLKRSDSFRKIESRAMKALEKSGFEPQFVTVCRQEDLAPAGKNDRKLIILAAARLGEARLIDNIEFRVR